MSFSLDPRPRPDFYLEGEQLLDGSGNWTSDWMETEQGDAHLRLALYFINNFPGSVTIQEGAFDGGLSGSSFPRVIREQSVTVTGSYAYDQLDLTTRYFRVVVVGGDPNDYVTLTVRKV